MNSKEFSELLVSKRNESGVSVDQMAARLGVSVSTVKSVEDGIHNLSMKIIMDYISCLGFKLVISTTSIDQSNLQIFHFSSYKELVEWVASRWPWKFKRKSRLDANGIEYVKIIDSQGKEIEFDKYLFLNLIEKGQYDLEVLSEYGIEQKQIQFKEQYDKEQKSIHRSAKIALVGLICAVVLFIYLDILITTNLPDEWFRELGLFGGLISLHASTGLIFPFIVVGLAMALVIYIIYKIIKNLP